MLLTIHITCIPQTLETIAIPATCTLYFDHNTCLESVRDAIAKKLGYRNKHEILFALNNPIYFSPVTYRTQTLADCIQQNLILPNKKLEFHLITTQQSLSYQQQQFLRSSKTIFDFDKLNQAERSNHYIALTAIEQNSQALYKVAPYLQDNPDFILAIIQQQQDAFALDWATMNIKSNRELMLAAIQIVPNALSYLPSHLQADKELVRAAIQQDGNLLAYASPNLQLDPELLILAKRTNPDLNLSNILSFSNIQIHTDCPRFVEPETVEASSPTSQYELSSWHTCCPVPRLQFI